jgi:hypothetical protein
MADKLEKTRKKTATKKRAKAKKPAVVRKKKVVQKQNVRQSVKIVIGDSKKRKAPALRRVAAATKTAPPSVPVVNYHRIDIPYYRAVENDRRPAPLFDDSVNRHQTHQARAIVPPDRDPHRDMGNDLLTARDLADFRQDVSRRFGALTQRVAGGLGDVSRHVSRTSYQLGEDLGNLVEDSNRRQAAANPSLTADQVHDVVSYANMVQTQNQPPSLTRADLDEFRETVDLDFNEVKNNTQLAEPQTSPVSSPKATVTAETQTPRQPAPPPEPSMPSIPEEQDETSLPGLEEEQPKVPPPSLETEPPAVALPSLVGSSSSEPVKAKGKDDDAFDPDADRVERETQPAGTSLPVGGKKKKPPTVGGKKQSTDGKPTRSRPPPQPPTQVQRDAQQSAVKTYVASRARRNQKEGEPVVLVEQRGQSKAHLYPKSAEAAFRAYVKNHATGKNGSLVYEGVADFEELMKLIPGVTPGGLKGRLKRANQEGKFGRFY